jgi:hypothetical protein
MQIVTMRSNIVIYHLFSTQHYRNPSNIVNHNFFSTAPHRLDEGSQRLARPTYHNISVTIPSRPGRKKSVTRGGQSHLFRFPHLSIHLSLCLSDFCPYPRLLTHTLKHHPLPLPLHKKTSRLNSSVLTGYGSSNFPSTLGCRIPKTPIVWFLPPRLSLIAAAWPGRKVGSVIYKLALHLLILFFLFIVPHASRKE